MTKLLKSTIRKRGPHRPCSWCRIEGRLKSRPLIATGTFRWDDHGVIQRSWCEVHDPDARAST